ncbi:hypothetical protein N7510_010319 [Penicillium lagena]|uniref:uncharacterized protein n=1 Tax=Penicillium lagena TaxID=94218 RepID=UPI002540C8D7|nr:uncharacterized protein N7510_010319 [Penicillium lagena]KAJ5605165.1 hypothetical protein N7510_010319 [Penicillium lagena]
MAYDVDHSTSGTIFEYNVSHDNEGGFFLICPYDKPTQNFTIRYNLSVNDRTRIVEICDGQLVNGKIYKNTIFIGDGISPFIVTEDTDASLDVLLTDNIIYKTGSGHGQWQLNDTVFSVNHNLFFGPIDAYDEATFNTTSAPGLAAAGLRDPKAYLLLSGSAAFDSAVAVAGDAHKDFFSDPTAAYKNLGFYAGPATERPIWVDDFNQNSSLAPGWSSSGQVAIIADPAGDLGQSVQMSPTSTFSHALDVKSSFRLNARIWVASSNIHDGVSPSICLQGVSSAIVLSNFPGLLPGQWQIIEVYVSKEGARLDATVSLDGEPFPISSRKNKLSCAGVNFNSGGTTLYVDDVLLTPL